MVRVGDSASPTFQLERGCNGVLDALRSGERLRFVGHTVAVEVDTAKWSGHYAGSPVYASAAAPGRGANLSCSRVLTPFAPRMIPRADHEPPALGSLLKSNSTALHGMELGHSVGGTIVCELQESDPLIAFAELVDLFHDRGQKLLGPGAAPAVFASLILLDMVRVRSRVSTSR